MKLLLFGGTEEGRVLAQRLAAAGISVTCSVATAYGAALLPPQENLTVRQGRLEAEEMARWMQREGFDRVVDATHPYAAQVSENIRLAARQAKLPLHRLLRPSQRGEGGIWLASPAEAAAFLSEREGNALLTTGSKELAAFTAVPDYRERLWVRVLPSVNSLKSALELGFPPGHIICMQGPFSRRLNAATLLEIKARWLVTKDSGKAGGFAEKLSAAQDAGAEALVIGRPTAEEGETLEEIYRTVTAAASIR